MKTSLFGLSLCLVFCLAGCSSTPVPVSVKGTAAGMQQLAGEWEGEYSSEATGRSGTIQFKLVPGENQARGDVLMVSRGSTVPYQAAVSTGREQAHAGSQLLTIRFVTAEGGSVSGKLDPYHDPDCDCEVETTFTGKRQGDVIEGTFASVSSRTAGRAGGRWRVTRKPA